MKFVRHNKVLAAVGTFVRSCRKAWMLVTVTTMLFCSAAVAEQTLSPINRDLPDFSLQGIDGKVYQPETLQGRTWLINFWAVWCAPCLEELPALNRAWAQLKDENVGMLAINIGEDADKIESFLKENNLQIDFPIVIGDKIRTLGNWSGRALPHTVVVSPAGRVVYEAVGPREWDHPEFVNAVLALNGSVVPPSVSDRIAARIAQFHGMTKAAKILIVVFILYLVGVLMYVIHRLGRKKIDHPEFPS